MALQFSRSMTSGGHAGEALKSRCLIFHPYKRDPRAGGPAGFIAQNIPELDTPIFSVSPAPVERHGASAIERLSSAISASPRRWLQGIRTTEVNRRRTFIESGAAAHKAIWFHDSGTYAAFADLIHPRQKLIYQPHCPQLPWEERETPSEIAASRRLTEDLAGRAAMVVLPNEYCREIYGALFEQSKIVYNRSACAEPPKTNKIPLDPAYLYFLYIGRRSPIKGFDLVIDAFARAHERRREIRLIICGDGPSVEASGVIDVGRTDRIHDWISAASCVVNANRQSYFDLSVLEALALGAVVALTPTNGHKELLSYGSPGMVPVEPNVVSLECLFLTFNAACRTEHARDENIRIYRENYSSDVYRKRMSDEQGELFRSMRSLLAAS